VRGEGARLIALLSAFIHRGAQRSAKLGVARLRFLRRAAFILRFLRSLGFS